MIRNVVPSHRLAKRVRSAARPVIFTLLSGMCVLAASSVRAQIYASFELSGRVESFNTFIEPAPISFSANGALSTQINRKGDQSISGMFGTALTDAGVFASVGRLGVQSSSTVSAESRGWFDQFGVFHQTGRHFGNGISSASAGWHEQVKFDVPGMQGQHGSFDAMLRLNGSFSAKGGAGINVSNPDSSSFSVGHESQSRVMVLGSGLGTPPFQDCLTKTGLTSVLACAGFDSFNAAANYSLGGVIDLPVKVQFTFGEFFLLGYSINSFTEARAQLTFNQMARAASLSTADVDLSHTLLWGGIQAVFGPDGAPLSTPYALTSASGFDYRSGAPVPEPQTWALLLVGLALLALAQRRRVLLSANRLGGAGLFFAVMMGLAGSAHALNPQPLPPGGVAALINPNGPLFLNPQPLPPAGMFVFRPESGATALNLQALPPGALSIDTNAASFAGGIRPDSNPIGVGTWGQPPFFDDVVVTPHNYLALQGGDLVFLNPQPLPPGGVVAVFGAGFASLPPGGIAANLRPADWASLNPQPLPPLSLLGFIGPLQVGQSLLIDPQALGGVGGTGLLTVIKLGSWLSFQADSASLDLPDGSLLLFSQVASVPEPASAVLAVLGGLLLFLLPGGATACRVSRPSYRVHPAKV